MTRVRAMFAALALSACVQTGAAENPHAMTTENLPALFDCLRERGQTIVAAHRGGPSPGFAENAMPTLAHVLSQGPVMLEIDIRRTQDGALVLMHDETIDRTTTGSGPVADLTLAAIQAFQLEDESGADLDAHPPTLQDALEWAAGRTVLELDVKRGVPFEDVVEAVRAARAENRVIVITYNEDDAVRVHQLAPELMVSVSLDDAADLDALATRGVDLSRVLAWTGTRAPNSALNVALAQRGVEAMFGTLGRPGESWDSRFASAGDERYAAFADAGLQLIATDRPLEAARDLDAHDGVDGHGALQCVPAS